MSELPQVIQIGPYPYRVTRDAEEHRQHELEVDGRVGHTNGICRRSALVITLDPSNAEAKQRAVLLHETLHACVEATGVQISDAVEERLITALAPLLLDTLQRNPDLVKYLCDKEPLP